MTSKQVTSPITLLHLTPQATSWHQNHPASNFMTSKQVTSPPWNRRLVHSKEMVGASRVHVADHLSLEVQRHIRRHCVSYTKGETVVRFKTLLTHFALDRSWPIDQWDSRWQKNKQDGKVKNAKTFPWKSWWKAVKIARPGSEKMIQAPTLTSYIHCENGSGAVLAAQASRKQCVIKLHENKVW